MQFADSKQRRYEDQRVAACWSVVWGSARHKVSSSNPCAGRVISPLGLWAKSLIPNCLKKTMSLWIKVAAWNESNVMLASIAVSLGGTGRFSNLGCTEIHSETGSNFLYHYILTLNHSPKKSGKKNKCVFQLIVERYDFLFYWSDVITALWLTVLRFDVDFFCLCCQHSFDCFCLCICLFWGCKCSSSENHIILSM